MNDSSDDKLLSLIPEISCIPLDESVKKLKSRITGHKRKLSIEQAKIITRTYENNRDKSTLIKRAMSLKASMEELSISIEPDELIPGNRSSGFRDGVVFPEAGISWLENEIDTLSFREQDRFDVSAEDKDYFLNQLVPFWKGKTLEEYIGNNIGTEISEFSSVVKINQKDHAQGHIIPDVEEWLKTGPEGLKQKAEAAGKNTRSAVKKEFYDSVILVLDGACRYIERFRKLAGKMAKETSSAANKINLLEIESTCTRIAKSPPESFREALQSIWFLFVILQMESNASSFSPGRMDQYLFPYFKKDLESGKMDLCQALKLLENLFLNFNKIVYMRNSDGAKYFAGFPIGFNISIGGKTDDGNDGVNALSYLILKAQEQLGLPQPNLTARLHRKSPNTFIDACSKVIGLGSGMPQIVNDESIIPALKRLGISEADAVDYGLVGCVELSTQGNNLGWSDAAMFNLVKVLELTLNNGRCLLTGEKLGIDTGNLTTYGSMNEMLEGYRMQMDYFIDKMMDFLSFVDEAHAVNMPSPFLSSAVSDCISNGIDVTAGGAKYNLSGIQAIQPANLADSLAVLNKIIFMENAVKPEELLSALESDWFDQDELRFMVMNHVPKYGNDIEWVDNYAADWCSYFASRLEEYTNIRGGRYHMGLYTVSAHVPMGKNVAATPDGRKARSPLADGGVSPTYGLDKNGPTAVLKSVSRLNFNLASNGSLLNMKFLPSMFTGREERKKFNAFLRVFIRMNIHHIQFNVVSRDDLIRARENPEAHQGMTVRVAGYTAYFTELAHDLQNEIIMRTAHTLGNGDTLHVADNTIVSGLCYQHLSV